MKSKALIRIRNNLTTKQAKILYTSFIISNFNYCPLVWMFSRKEGNRLLERAHCRALRGLTNNFTSEYTELLCQANEIKIHRANLEKLALEVYSALQGFTPDLITNIFENKKEIKSLRKGALIQLPPGDLTNTWVYRGILLWNNLPRDIKECSSKNTFKSKIKNCHLYCKCKICS